MNAAARNAAMRAEIERVLAECGPSVPADVYALCPTIESMSMMRRVASDMVSDGRIAIDDGDEVERLRLAAQTRAPNNDTRQFALWSDGRLSIRAGNRRLSLSADDTRALIAYLDRVLAVDDTTFPHGGAGHAPAPRSQS